MALEAEAERIAAYATVNHSINQEDWPLGSPYMHAYHLRKAAYLLELCAEKNVQLADYGRELNEITAKLVSVNAPKLSVYAPAMGG